MAGKDKQGDMIMKYKGRPLVRSGNTIYYGDMADPYVAMLQFSDTVDFADMKLPSKVIVQVLSTDEELGLKERIKKRAEKPNLYEAINIAAIWLDRIGD